MICNKKLKELDQVYDRSLIKELYIHVHVDICTIPGSSSTPCQSEIQPFSSSSPLKVPHITVETV